MSTQNDDDDDGDNDDAQRVHEQAEKCRILFFVALSPKFLHRVSFVSLPTHPPAGAAAKSLGRTNGAPPLTIRVPPKAKAHSSCCANHTVASALRQL